MNHTAIYINSARMKEDDSAIVLEKNDEVVFRVDPNGVVTAKEFKETGVAKGIAIGAFSNLAPALIPAFGLGWIIRRRMKLASE